MIRSEIEALENNKKNIVESFNVGEESFDLVDLGAGDAMKTSILIHECLAQSQNMTYVPVDISPKFIKDAQTRFKDIRLPIKPLIGNYFDIIPTLGKKTRKVICFLGSNIGNFKNHEEDHFLTEVRKIMHPKDILLLGCDLIKDPKVILQAYNDREGHTKRFNLNMLERINRDLGGNINKDNFIHYPIFDPLEPGAKSFLVSTKDQIVELKKYNKTINFHKWEHIHTETSRKYSVKSLDHLAERTGLKIKDHFFCTQKGYVVASLMRAVDDSI